jgi:CAAX protease family protein
MLKIRYFRYYPWALQLLLFLMLIVTMMGVGSLMALTFIPKFTPYNLGQIEVINENSPMGLVDVAIIVQGMLSLLVFLMPAFLFAYLSHPRPLAYLGLKAPGKGIQLLLVVLMMLGAIPVLQMIEGLISHIDFGTKVKESQAASDSMMSAFLNVPTFSAFVKAFVVMAIIPAMGEELFFRGILLRFARKKTMNMIFPVLFTAIIFSYSHTNIYGFLSIFLAGVILAVIYNITGSLWCSILGHVVFNGSQVVLAYMSSSNTAIKTFMSNTSLPVSLVVGGAILFGISFYLLLKNKTPLPANWTDDFTPEELTENAL